MEQARQAAVVAAKAATQDGVIPTLVGSLVAFFVGVVGGRRLNKKAV